MRKFSAVVRVSIVAVLFCSVAAEAAMESRIEGKAFRGLSRPLAPGSRVSLERIPLGDSVATLDLERFEVWAPDAQIVVDHGGGRRETIAPPPVQYFRGTVAGDPESMVFVAARNDGAVESLVISHERRYRMRSRNAEERDVFVEETSLTDDEDVAGETGFMCELDQKRIEIPSGVPTVRNDALVAADGTLSGTGTWTLNLAIETDHELYTDLGSNAANVTTFIGNLVGQASVIYQRDLTTDLVIAFTRVQTSASDPFNVVPGQAGTWNGGSVTYTTSHALAELGDLWANAATRPFSGARSAVALVSGKNQTAGVAWTARACRGDFTCSAGNCGDPLFDGHTGGAYSYTGLGNQSTTAVPDPNATNNGVLYGLPSSNYWALLGFAHELGHNVDGPHTHCVALTAEQKAYYGVTRNFVDECVQGCFSGTTSVPAEKGSIMSYCHLLGSSQSRFTFGRALETSELMVNRIRAYINNWTPASPSLSAPSSLGAGESGTASIVSPVAGLTYNWTITNGTINGSTVGTSVNFTAATHPVTLRVRAVNSGGCAASDYRTVTVASCTAPALTSVTSSLAIIQGSAVQLSATASGSAPITYQWYVGSPGNTSTPAGAGNPISVAPASTTTYWVRATNSCGSADSGGVTVTVNPPPANTSLYVITPCRVIDTRGPVGEYGGPALANAATRTAQMTGVCGIPATAKAIVANVTTISPSTAGFLSFYPAGTIWPGNSTVNYRSGKTRANNSILVLAPDGRITVLNSGATQHFIVDVTGYFE